MDTLPELLGLIEYNLERAKYYEGARGGVEEARRVAMCLRSADDVYDYPSEWLDHLVKYVCTAIEAVSESVIGSDHGRRSLSLVSNLTPTEMLAFAASPVLYPAAHEGAPGYSTWVRSEDYVSNGFFIVERQDSDEVDDD